jgi:serine O-acetyltransferase
MWRRNNTPLAESIPGGPAQVVAIEAARFRYLRFLLTSDLYRYAGRSGLGCGLRYFVSTPGYRFTALLRIYQWLRHQWWRWLIAKPLVALLLRHYSFKFGFDISPDVAVGSGLYIGHFGGVVINRDVIIGANCNLSHEVTLGQVNRGERAGCPVIGDNVYIGPGAKIIGSLRVGDNSAVGANAVVLEDVPENVAVGGVPARIISNSGSTGYINRTDYPPYGG